MKTVLVYPYIFTPVLMLLFRGPIYRFCVVYKAIGTREDSALENPKIRAELDAWIQQQKHPGTADILAFSRAYTSERLSYTFGKCSSNPNAYAEKGRANCVGYSALFQAVALYLFSRNGQSGEVQCEHKIGRLYLFGFNVHRFFSDPAFQDHDYNVVWDKRTNQKYAIDPTLSDYLGIESVKE